MALIALCLSNICWAKEMEAVKITGAQLKACAVALEDFSKGKDAANLTNFTVEVSESKDSREVIFIPNQVPGEPTTRGGKTKYGTEVHYLISNDKNIIIRKSFAR